MECRARKYLQGERGRQAKATSHPHKLEHKKVTFGSPSLSLSLAVWLRFSSLPPLYQPPTPTFPSLPRAEHLPAFHFPFSPIFLFLLIYTWLIFSPTHGSCYPPLTSPTPSTSTTTLSIFFYSRYVLSCSFWYSSPAFSMSNSDSSYSFLLTIHWHLLMYVS